MLTTDFKLGGEPGNRKSLGDTSDTYQCVPLKDFQPFCYFHFFLNRPVKTLVPFPKPPLQYVLGCAHTTTLGLGNSLNQAHASAADRR